MVVTAGASTQVGPNQIFKFVYRLKEIENKMILALVNPQFNLERLAKTE